MSGYHGVECLSIDLTTWESLKWVLRMGGEKIFCLTDDCHLVKVNNKGGVVLFGFFKYPMLL